MVRGSLFIIASGEQSNMVSLRDDLIHVYNCWTELVAVEMAKKAQTQAQGRFVCDSCLKCVDFFQIFCSGL